MPLAWLYYLYPLEARSEKGMYSEEQVREMLEPYFPRFFPCFVRALRQYQHEPLYAIVTKRSNSSNRNDLIWYHFKREFEDDEEITFTHYRNSIIMNIGDSLCFRVKKFDARLRPQNQITQHVLEFEGEIEQLVLPGMEPPMNLDIGYRFDDLAEDRFSVFVRCPDGLGKHRWVIRLEETEELLEPATDLIPQSADLGPRVRTRKEGIASAEEASRNANGR